MYKATYDSYVRETIDGPFEVNTIQSRYDTYAALVEPYGTSEVSGLTFLESANDFPVAISALKQHAASRTTAAESYLK